MMQKPEMYSNKKKWLHESTLWSSLGNKETAMSGLRDNMKDISTNGDILEREEYKEMAVKRQVCYGKKKSSKSNVKTYI